MKRSLLSILLLVSVSCIPLDLKGQTLVPSSTSYCEGSAGVTFSVENSVGNTPYTLQKQTGSTWSNIETITSPLAGGTFSFTGSHQEGNYRLFGATVVIAITKTLLPENLYNVTGGGAYCDNTTTYPVIGLSGSQTNIVYKLYKDNVWYNNKQANGTGIAFSFGTIQDAGTYTVRAERSGCQRIMTGSKQVIVHPTPQVSFTTNNLLPPDNCGVVAFNPVITYTPAGSGAPYSYLWNFGTSSTPPNSVQPAPTCQFPAYGTASQTFPVSLQVTDVHGCVNSSTSDVTVLERPDALVVPQNGLWSNCNADPLATFTITIVNKSTTTATNTGYFINWDDNPTDTVTLTTAQFQFNGTITHTYNSKGTFHLSVTATGPGPNNCNGTRIFPVFNGSNPSGGIQYDQGSLQGCRPDTITFKLTGDAQNNAPTTFYYFDFGDGTAPYTFTQETMPPLQPDNFYHITHIYDVVSCPTPDHSFTLIHYVENPCSRVPNNVGGIKISEKSKAGFLDQEFPDDPVFVCAGVPKTYLNNTRPGCIIYGTNAYNETNYYWDFDNNGTFEVTGTSPVYTYPNIGEYLVTLKAYTGEAIPGNCGPDQIVRPVCVQGIPVANFTMPLNFCTGTVVQVDNNSTTSPECAIPYYAWSVTPNTGFVFTGNTGPGSSEPKFQFSQAGVYTVQLAVSVLSGTSACHYATYQQVITVAAPPAITLVQPSVSLCGQGTVDMTGKITYQENQGPITSYNWSVAPAGPMISDPTAPFPTVTVTDDITMDYILTVTITNQCGTMTSLPFTVMVTKTIADNQVTYAGQTDLCSGMSLTQQITGSQPSGGTTIYGFQWQIDQGAGFVNINGANAQNLNYNLPLTNNPTLFRRMVQSGACTLESNVIMINILPGIQQNTVSQNQSICNGQTPASLTGTLPVNGTGTFTYLWQKADNAPALDNWANATGTINELNYSPGALTLTTRYRRLVFSGTCESVSNAIDVTVNEIPQINSPAAKVACSGVPLDYSITCPVSGTQYSWSVVDLSGGTVTGWNNYAGGPQSVITDVLVNNAATDKTIQYLITPVGPATTNCTGSNFTLTVTVHPKMTSTYENKIINKGTSTTLTGSIDGGTSPYNYYWEPSMLVTGQNLWANPQTVNLWDPHTYNLTVTDYVNCPYYQSVIVTTTGLSLKAVITSNFSDSTLCDGNQVVLTAVPTGGAGAGTQSNYTYSWHDLPAGATFPQPWIAQFIPAQTGINTYSVTIGDGFTTAYDNIVMTVNVLPTVTSVLQKQICSGENVNYTPTSGVNGTTFQWSRGVNPCVMSVQPNPTGSGTISNILTNSCSTPEVITYTITPTGPAPTFCPGQPSVLEVTVMPVASITNTTLSQVVVSGQSSLPVTFTSNVGGAGFYWEFSSITCPGFFSPYLMTGNTSTLPGQFLSILPGGPSSCTLTYKVTANVTLPGGTKCWGTPVYYNFIVNAEPVKYTLQCPVPVCEGTPVSVNLDDSDLGVDYQLLINSVPVLNGMQPGTGNPLAWLVTSSGAYSVLATNTSNQQAVLMNGLCHVEINPNPVSNYVIGSTGNCAGDHITLNGSQSGVVYELFNGSTNTLISRNGPGPLDFGAQQNSGNYRIRASYILTGCSVWIDGAVTLMPVPQPYLFTPAGVFCAGDEFSLEDSDPGILYSLICTPLTGAQTTQGPWMGTGLPINFGPQLVAGSYQVLAYNPLTGCDVLMPDIKTLLPNPVPYNVTPSQPQCGLTEIGLANSQTGFTYRVHRVDASGNPYALPDPAFTAQTGVNGQPLVFGSTSVPFTYCVLAYDQFNICNSQMNGLVTILSAPNTYQMLPTGAQCVDPAIGIELFLQHSDAGVIYTLILNGGSWSRQVTGTGAPGQLSLGFVTSPGNYTVVASVQGSQCNATMTGSLTLNLNPVQYVLNPSGDVCPGATIWLSGSQPGTDYTLHTPGATIITLPGGGLPVNWGQHFVPGNYYVTAVNTSNSCNSTMTGTVVIHPRPLVYNVRPAGISCEPQLIGLDNGQVGVTYEIIHLDGSSLSPPVIYTPTTTGAFWFSASQMAGSYQVRALSTDNCDTLMNGTIIVDPRPTADAGPAELMICNLPPYSVALTGTATNYLSVWWTSPTNPSGSYFSNPGSLETNYTFTPADLANNEVTLNLHVYGTSGCVNTEVSDAITIHIQAPIVDAGPDLQICSNENAVLNGSVSGSTTTGQWLGGAGTFSPNRQTLNATYVPAPSEVGSIVSLTLMSTQAEPCPNIVDEMLLTIYSPMVPGSVSPDQTICYNQSPQPVVATPPSGGSGQFAWQWQQLYGINWISVSGANDLIYAPDPLVTTTHYRLLQLDLHCSPIQSVVTAVHAVIVLAPMAAGTIQSNQSVCNGEVPSPLTATAPNGGSSQYGFQWQSKSGVGDWTDIPDAINLTYTPVALTATTEYRMIQRDINCTPVQETITNVITVTVFAPISPGTVTNDQSVCYGGIPQMLQVTSPSGGSGNYQYQWQSKTGTGTWNNVPLGTSPVFAPPALYTTTLYRVLHTDLGCNPDQTAVTNVITITVWYQLTPGTTGMDQTICYGEVPNPLLMTSPGGGSGNFSFQWQKDSGTGWVDISGATSGNFSPSSLTLTTQYRVVQSDHACLPVQTVLTNIATITVRAQLQSGTLQQNQVICYNTVPLPINLTTPSGGSGSFTYLWQSKTFTGGWTNITLGTSQTYSPSSLTETMQYRVVQTDQSCNPTQQTTSNVITVTVRPVLGSGNASSDQVLCNGESPQPLTLTNPAGGSGTFTYQWQSKSGVGTWINISGANVQNYTPGNLTVTTQYRVLQQDISCNPLQQVTSNVVTISIFEELRAGAAAPDQTICFGHTPDIISANPPAGGSGNFTYQWQAKEGSGAWQDLTGENDLNLLPGSLTTTTQYRIIQRDQGCETVQSVVSNIVTIFVHEELMAGAAGNNQTICYGEKPIALSATGPTGGSGTFTYQWQIKVGAGTWTNILNAMQLSFSPPNLTLTTNYRLLQRDPQCFPIQEKVTNEVVITVFSRMYAGSASGNQILCNGELPSVISATPATGGSGTFDYQWQSQVGSAGWFNIPFANGLTLNPGSLTQTTSFRMVQTDTYCNPDQVLYTNPVTITIYSPINSGAAGNNQDICYNTVPQQIHASAPSGGSGEFALQWQYKTGTGLWTDIANANTLTYNPPALMQTTKYRLMQIDQYCQPSQSIATNEVNITVFGQLVTGNATTDQTICRGEDPVPIHIGQVTGSSGLIEYQWQVQVGSTVWNNIPAATGADYDPPILFATTSYRVIQTDSYCEPVQQVTSNIVTITVYDLFTSGTAGPDQVICYGETPSILNLFPIPGGGSGNFSYQWEWQENGGIWTTIPGANGTTYQPNPLAATVRYRVIQTDLFCDPVHTRISNIVTVSVYNQLIAGNAWSNQTICYGEIPAPIVAQPPLGGSSHFIYNWQVMNGFGTWMNINGATTLTYAPPALFSTTQYRISQIDSECNPDQTAWSNLVTITVYPQLIPGTATNDQILCMNEIPDPLVGTMPAGGSGNTHLQWESKTAAGTWADIPNATGLIYPPPALTETTLFRLRQTDQFCTPDDEVRTNEVTLTVIPTPVPTVTGPSLVCIYSTGNIYQTQPGKQNYEWTVTGGVVSAGGGVNDYTITVTWNTLGVGTVTVNYRETVNNCPGAAPVVHQVNVVNPPVPTIATSPAGATVGCVDQCVTFETEAGMTNYQWNVSPGGQICSLGQPTDRRAVVKWTAAGSHWVSVNYLGAAGCIANLATVYPITIIPAPTPTITGPNTLCESGQINTYSTESGMNGYQWTVSSGGVIAGGFGSNQINVIWNTTGNHSVSVSYTNIFGCEAVTPTIYPVSVTPIPVPLLTGNSIACVGSNTNVYVTDPGNSAYVWTISGGGQILSGGAPNDYTVTVQWNTPGFQSVSVSYTNPNGCEPIIPTNLAVLVQPHPVPVIVGPSTICKSTSSVSYSTQAGMTNYSWVVSSGGQITNGTGTNTIYIQWFNAGSQTVSVNFTNTSGCSAVNPSTYTVAVSEWPTSNFTADTVCFGSPTPFNNLSTAGTGLIQSYFWEFGDGQISNIANPQHTYAATGTYPVKLTVTNSAGCYKDTTKMVLVWPKPNALFATSTQNCAGDSVQFTDLSSTGHGYISQWVWDFGDGSPVVTIPFPQNPNLKHKYQNGGSYYAKLTITTSDGCTSQKINTVAIAIRPLANFTSAAGSCADLPLQFTDLSQLNGGPPISGWNWNFGDPGSGTANFSSVQNPQHIFASGGYYQVWLQVTNANGCFDSISKQVTTHDRPSAKFSVDSSCIHSPTQFSDESTTPSGTIEAWLWNFGDPSSGTLNTSTLPNPQHTFTIPGTYWVSLQVTNSFLCVHDTMMLVTTNPKPVAAFSSSVACKGDMTTFTDLSIAPNSSLKAWAWDFGDGTTASIQNPQHNYQTAGTFSVKLLVTNMFNCHDSIIKSVQVRYKPEANYNYTTYFCPSGQVAFQDSSQAFGGASIDSRMWRFENGTSSTAINPVHIFPQPDQKYEVVLMVQDNFGCRDTIADSVMVKPGFDLTFNYDTACFGSLTHFRAINLATGDSLFSLHWDFGDPASGPNNYSNDSTPIHMFSGTGTYVVRLRAFNSDNCVDSLFKFVSVRKLPEPSFTASTEICNDTVWFIDKSKPGYGDIIKWTWHWGDGAVPLVILPPETGDTLHKFPSPETYNVKLIVTNEHGCTDSITKQVGIQCITAGFNQYGAFNCSSDSVGFADISAPVSNIAGWHWNFGDGNTMDYSSFRDTIRHKFQPGTYQVSLTVTTGGGAGAVLSTKQTTVTIHPAPVAAFSRNAVCLGDSTRFIDLAQDNNMPISTRTWSFGDGATITFTDTTINPVHKYSKPGFFNTRFRVSNGIGCSDSIVIPVRVHRLPVAAFSGSPPCQRYVLTYQDASTPGDTTMSAWYWFFNNPEYPFDTLRTQSVKQRFDSTGKYEVYFKVVDKYGCADDTVYQNFEVKPSPVAAFTITEEVDGRPGKIRLNNQCLGAMDKAWKWDYETGKSTERNPEVTYTNDKQTYTIQLVVWNDINCYDTARMTYSFEYDNLYVPNAFSPDSYVVDIRQFKPKGRNLKDYHIMIFNKAGHLLWESEEIDEEGRPVTGWDGTFKGNPLAQDVYIWKIQATFNNNKVWEGTDSGTGTRSTMGTVTLIR